MATKDSLKVSFKRVTETKGALRYQEITAEGAFLTIEEGAKVGTTYFRKSALDGDQPERIDAVYTFPT